MAEGRVIRLSWDEWRKGRAAKRTALAAHGLSGESRRTTAHPMARRQLKMLLNRDNLQKRYMAEMPIKRAKREISDKGS